jgi:hypothetical protein
MPSLRLQIDPLARAKPKLIVERTLVIRRLNIYVDIQPMPGALYL